jgi:hypothetical protein
MFPECPLQKDFYCNTVVGHGGKVVPMHSRNVTHNVAAPFPPPHAYYHFKIAVGLKRTVFSLAYLQRCIDAGCLMEPEEGDYLHRYGAGY